MAGFRERLTSALSEHIPHHMSVPGARGAAVLLPVVAAPEPTLLFTKRSDTVGTHKGQISFPGGGHDPGDPDMLTTALRETHEEIGLDPAAVTILGELDTFPTFISGYVVTPYVGWMDAEPSLTPNPAEVDEVLHVPIGDLGDEIRRDPGFSHGRRTYPTEAWVWNDNVIWGVTARIVRQFLDILAGAGLAAPQEGTMDWRFPPRP